MLVPPAAQDSVSVATRAPAALAASIIASQSPTRCIALWVMWQISTGAPVSVASSSTSTSPAGSPGIPRRTWMVTGASRSEATSMIMRSSSPETATLM